MEILNAHAEAVEAKLAERFAMLPKSDARVDLDANLTVGVEMEMLFGACEQILDLCGRQVGRSAAAPMKLDHGAILRDAAADALHLPLQHVKIGWRNVLVFLNDDVAGAKEAEAFTEGNVHIERNGRPGTLSFFVHAFEIGWAKSVIPDWRRGIACVAGPRTIVFGEEFLADMKLAAHLLQGWMCEGHA